MRNERQGAKWLGVVQAAVLVGWTTALWWLGRGSGDDALLGRFLRSDYWWIVYTAIGIFVVLLGSLVVSQPRQLRVDPRRSLIQAIILSLPLLYLPLAISSELSIEAAEKRSLYTPRVVVRRSESPKPMAVDSESSIQAPEKRSLLTPRPVVEQSESRKPTRTDHNLKTPLNNSRSATTSVKSHKATFLDLVSDPEAFERSNATAVGMVYRDKRLPSNSFFCYRLMMVCCAADASPVGLIVKWPQTSELQKGTWVQVRGRVCFTMFEGENHPTISATKVEKTSPPKNRFILPK